MKKNIFIFLFFLINLSIFGQNYISLDRSIDNSFQRIYEGLESGAKIIVYQFKSQNPELSDYVLNELFDKLVNSKKFIVLDRGAEEVINAELDFQFKKSEGMINDESLASLTKRIGAEAIITGSLDEAGKEYRFRIRVIGIETMAAIVSYSAAIDKNDKTLGGFKIKAPKTTAVKLGTGMLNIALGLGSYIEGDIAGGITITSGYVIATGFFAYEIFALNLDSPAAGIPATIGVGIAGLTLVYGFLRPFIYNRTARIAAVFDNTQFKIVQTSNSLSGNRFGFQFFYTWNF